MRTLVAAPTTSRKRESFLEWAAATASYERLVVLDDDDADYADTLDMVGVHYIFFTPSTDDKRKGPHRMCGPLFNEAWAALLARADDYTHVLSLDTDVLPPAYCDIVALMENNYHDCDFLIHGVPWRSIYKKSTRLAYETSCTFATVPIWRKALALALEDTDNRQLYRTVRYPCFRVREISLVNLEHRND